MKKLIGGVLAALAVGVGLGVAPVASADHCDPPGSPCHEFDQFDPYLDAFYRHGLDRLADIPTLNAAMGVCLGRETQQSIWADPPNDPLTRAEAREIVLAAMDVCPEVVG